MKLALLLLSVVVFNHTYYCYGFQRVRAVTKFAQTRSLNAKRRTTLSRRGDKDSGTSANVDRLVDDAEKKQGSSVPRPTTGADLLQFRTKSEISTSSSPTSSLSSSSSSLRESQPQEQNQNQLQQAQRLKAVFGGSISEQLQNDISGFEELALASAREQSANGSAKEDNAVVSGLKNAFSAVLIADFFLVIFFLVWFLAAAAMQKTNPFLLERFQDIFQPVVVPSLTVLMTGSIASGVMGGDGDKDKQQKPPKSYF